MSGSKITRLREPSDRFVITRESHILYTPGDRVIGKRVMAIQYALLSLGTGVISSSQVHDTFHTVHIYMYRVFMHKCIAPLRASGRAQVACACARISD